MRTSALALCSKLRREFVPFVQVADDCQWNDIVAPIGGATMTAIADPVILPSRPKWLDWILKATHMTYGGAGITTNRLNGGGTAPTVGGWGLNPTTLTTSISDTALFDPAPEARVAGTYTQQTTNAAIPNDTAQVVATIQASAARAIMEFGLFDSTTAPAQTTTAATVSSTTVTTVSVASTTGFSNGSFAQIDSEVVSISGSSAGTLTVGRGARGSTAATHASGANVVQGEGSSNMFMKGDFAVVNLNSGDSIQFTAKVQYQPQ